MGVRIYATSGASFLGARSGVLNLNAVARSPLPGGQVAAATVAQVKPTDAEGHGIIPALAGPDNDRGQPLAGLG
jgi:hypothetical protein